jgi:membrane protein required for colicin V production
MSDLPVTLGDVIVVAILLASGLLAFVRGFVQEVLDVAAWIGAIVAAVYAYPLVAPLLLDIVSDTRIANIAAGLAVFFVAIIVLSILTRLISRSVRTVGLGPLDRSLGFAFGLARGALLVVLVYIGVNFLVKPADQPEWLKNAKTYDLVASGAAWVRTLVPGGAGDEARTTADQANEAVRRAMDAERIYREMVSPEPKSQTPADPGRPQGYGDKERQDMQRLLESSTGGR